MEIGIEWGISITFIIICAIFDIRKKEIPIFVIILFGCISILFIGISGKRTWADIMYSLAPGGFLLLLSLCTRESIGYGDGMAVLVLGILMGYRGCIVIIIIGFISSAFCALVLLVCGKVKGKSRLPFLPFLAIGLGVFYIAQNNL